MSPSPKKHPRTRGSRAPAAATELPADTSPGIHLHPLAPIFLLVVVLLCVFAVVVSGGFSVYDDNVNITGNPYLHPVTSAGLARLWQHPYLNLYIPLTYTVWAAVAVLSGASGGAAPLDPHVFHALNLVGHILCALLVYRILRQLGYQAWPAAAGALLFGIHPVQVEPVAWVTGLKDVLGGLLSLAALSAYLTHAQAEEGHWSSYLLATASFVLAMLAKPSAVTVPLLAWVLDALVVKRSVRASALSLLPWVLAAVPVLLLTRASQPVGSFAPASAPWSRPFIAGDALAFYLGKLLLPFGLGVDYGRTPARVLSHGWAYAAWLVPAACAVGIWLGRVRRPWLAAAGALLVAAVLPVLGLVPFGFQVQSTVGDRYLYVAMLGPALALAGLLSVLNNRTAQVACGAWLLVLAGLSGAQARYWNNDVALFSQALAVNPRSWMAHNNLGLALLARRQPERAAAEFRESLRWKPDYIQARNDLAIALAAQGKPREAIEELTKALAARPDHAPAHNNLGNILASQGRLPEALDHYREALRLDPDYTDAKGNLDRTTTRLAGEAQAAERMAALLRTQPDNAELRVSLGMLLTHVGRTAEARREFETALRLKPGLPAAREALDRLNAPN